jgi:hypothetical protein
MKAVRWMSLILVALMALPTVDVEARRRRSKKRKKQKQASKAQAKAIGKLLGKFKWGLSSGKVVGMLEKEIRAEFDPKIRKEKDPIAQDKLRREMKGALVKLKKNHVKFTGKRSPWDVSLVENEFAHKNNESMVVRWGKRDRRFFFFHQGRLWKMYIAFNAELFRGKTFGDFTRMMQRRFGEAEAKWKLDVKGDSVMSHLEWPVAGNTVLIALDETAFYGNFCLVLTDKARAAQVREGRKINSPKRNYADPLVSAVAKKKGSSSSSGGSDPNADIIDQITGKPQRGVAPSKSSGTARKSPSSGSPDPAPAQKKRKKKLNPKDPLSGLDI